MRKRNLLWSMVVAAGLLAGGNALAAPDSRDYDGDRGYDRDHDRRDRDRHDDRDRNHGRGRDRDYRRDYARDRDDNPPGRRGGPGTNWENPPGWRGGPGASPDYRYYRHGGERYRFRRVDRGYYFSNLYGYYHPDYGWWQQSLRCWLDRDDNPPGPRGGRGTNWENPPGWRGGPGASPDRFGRCR